MCASSLGLCGEGAPQNPPWAREVSGAQCWSTVPSAAVHTRTTGVGISGRSRGGAGHQDPVSQWFLQPPHPRHHLSPPQLSVSSGFPVLAFFLLLLQ